MLNYPYRILGTGADPKVQRAAYPVQPIEPPRALQQFSTMKKKKKREGRKKSRKISPLNLHPKFTLIKKGYSFE
jgi:hypothetical protein